MVVCTEECVQHKQLSHNVTEIQELDGEIQHDDIVPVFAAADQAAVPRHKVLDVDAASLPVLAGAAQIAVHMLGHEL